VGKQRLRNRQQLAKDAREKAQKAAEAMASLFQNPAQP
jgi:hypothetical protein